MAFIGIQIDPENSKELAKIKVPGKKEDPRGFHVTMFYLGKKKTVKEVMDATLVMAGVLKSAEPFKIKTKEVTCFPEGPDGVPVICKVESEDLIKLREKIKKAFIKSKIDFSNNYPDYKPHITLSYHTKEIDDFDIKPITCKVNEITVWAGDQDFEGVRVEVPVGHGGKIASLDLIGDLLVKFAEMNL
jgi:2'-5' RNA ligase